MNYIYLIRSGEYFKIGIANDPASRLAQLQTGNPQELEIYSCFSFDDASSVERALHQAFKNSRHFLEWFKLSTDEVYRFDDICKMLGGQVAASYLGQASNSQIEEAEEIDISLEDVRTEIRMANGEPRGVVLIERNSGRRVVGFFNKSHPDFDKYLELYKQEHPGSKVLK